MLLCSHPLHIYWQKDEMHTYIVSSAKTHEKYVQVASSYKKVMARQTREMAIFAYHVTKKLHNLDDIWIFLQR